MGFLDFDIKEPVHLNWTGKFIAPDENWVHISRALTDFELIVMTEGDLYIADTEGEYVIHQGEYRLMCPSSHLYGYHSSLCSFCSVNPAFDLIQNKLDSAVHLHKRYNTCYKNRYYSNIIHRYNAISYNSKQIR